jgi:MoaA/NifB/PqqE/SkfB family radical SAM enzyme
MDKTTILKAIKELGEMGVVWLGLTGGEPLLNKDIVEIIDKTDKNIAIKLFTTGYRLTKQQAIDLKKAGLSYVSVSLDSQIEEEHDRNRRYRGAFRDALRSIEIFLESGIHTSVSSVLTREMMSRDKIIGFMDFLEKLKVHEAWLSEVKPSSEIYWNEDQVIRDEEISMLLDLQDEYNRKNKMTFNYLGHFENKKYFGCNAGNKMIYIDAFGEVSPCVFTPMTFGNISGKPLNEIYNAMRDHFRAGSTCFINKNYQTIRKHFRGEIPVPPEDSYKIVKESGFSEWPEFHKLMNQ